MTSTVLLSTAYFPPVHYLSLVAQSGSVLVEREENYIKQTYRNRCYILTSNGVISLTVPVLEGSFHKTPVKDIRIDYSKRWQQVHTRAIMSAYRSSPFFEFYFDSICNIINSKTAFLIDLNMITLKFLTETAELKTDCSWTSHFEPELRNNDLRYTLTPKKKDFISRAFHFRPYIQVFSDRFGFVPGLSTLDLLFNAGPETIRYLPEYYNNI